MAAPKHWAIHLRLSHHGAAFIALEEGVRTRPYADSRGLATTGVGHLITPAHRGVTPHDRAHWTFPTPRAAIDYFRQHDVIAYERAVRAALGESSITQAQYDMCVSLCFNIGTGGFASSSVARLIRAGKIHAAALAFYAWSNPPVLRPRRGRESHRFLVGHW